MTFSAVEGVGSYEGLLMTVCLFVEAVGDDVDATMVWYRD
jgi:hypothetical protein